MPNPVLNCPATDTPQETRMSFIVQRQGASSVPDGRGGYTDSEDFVAAYCGFVVQTKRRIDRSAETDQGLSELPYRIIIFEGLPGLDIRVDDKLLEAQDDGSGHNTVQPVPGGQVHLVFDVRPYDDETQVDTKHLLRK
jgi:hypothetical protein